MSSHLKLAPRSFPSRIADLGFTALLPADWISHDLPNEDVEFSNPTTLVPLALVAAPHSVMVFGFAARPAYDDGTLLDWANFLLNHNQLAPRALGRDVVAGVPAIVGEATQPSDFGVMVARFAFLEDGNRLLNLTLTAPEMLADTLGQAWFEMLKSFTLSTPRGSRFKPEPAPDAPASEPQSDRATIPAAEPPPAPPEILDSESGEPLLPIRTNETPPPPPSEDGRPAFHDFALSDDSISLDDDHPTNVNLRNRGVGLIPNIAGLSDRERRATLAAGAILAQFDVPYGWHVLDDGKRTLVFEPSGKVQISMNLIPREGRNDPAILDDLERQTRNDYPQPEFTRITAGRIQALGVRNIADGNQPLEQYHMLIAFRDDSLVLRARVTTTPDQAARACNLAELILNSCVFEPLPAGDEPDSEPESALQEPDADPTESKPDRQPGADGKPAWWHEALALEKANQLEAAEEHIRQRCQNIGSAYSTAEMYRLRMIRLKGEGDLRGAREAFLNSSRFIGHYAGMATSGGEGEALSLQRDEFRDQLVRDFGSDPEADGSHH
ncbi:MAG: hypothetical protein JNL10_15015 [Verrucomicrobiales bacterium]|nr:hypothetical protein [Verrucomicrobiales bacterium]